MGVCVISSIYGGYDTPRPPVPQDMPCDWILVTDREGAPPPWRVVVEPRPGLHPRLAAKVAKCCPAWYSDADVLIWVDGSVEIRAASFVSWCTARLGGAVLCQHLNPERVTIWDEVRAAAEMGKYAGLALEAQAAAYVAGGMPEGFGTWWTGLIVRARGCPDFGAAWLAEMVRWGYEDQLSEPWVLHRAGLRPVPLPVRWPDPGRFILRAHAHELLGVRDGDGHVFLATPGSGPGQAPTLGHHRRSGPS